MKTEKDFEVGLEVAYELKLKEAIMKIATKYSKMNFETSFKNVLRKVHNESYRHKDTHFYNEVYNNLAEKGLV